MKSENLAEIFLDRESLYRLNFWMGPFAKVYIRESLYSRKLILALGNRESFPTKLSTRNSLYHYQ